VTAVVWLAASYLLGAFPTSFVVGKLGRGVDLREQGSKNLGATNVYRVLGWKYAIPVAVVDVAKGAVPVALFGSWAALGAGWATAFGVSAVLGHVFSPFVGFKGGKGVATAAGMFLALAPLAVVIAIPVWAACLRLTGYVSLSSMIATTSFPVWVRLTAPAARPAFYASLGLAALIIFSHRANIRRLLAGTENRFRSRNIATPTVRHS
jgi:acyl phosphate:glycerol-3-phosphate acyltransferase